MSLMGFPIRPGVPLVVASTPMSYPLPILPLVPFYYLAVFLARLDLSRLRKHDALPTNFAGRTFELAVHLV